MQPLNFVQTILNGQQINDLPTLHFRPGQVISGQVTKLFPNQIAEVLIGSNRVIAQLETPLSVHERYWFQVQPGEGKVHLKVLDGNTSNRAAGNTETVLTALSLPKSKENASLLDFFQNKQLPITKETLQTAAHWLKGKSFPDGIKVIEMALTKQLPFTRTILNSLYTVQENESISTLLNKLETLLKTAAQPETANRLHSIVEQLRLSETKGEPAPLNQTHSINSNDMKIDLKNIIKTIGFSYENEAFKLVKDGETADVDKLEALKPQLIRLLSEEPPGSLRDVADRLLNKITGYQLLSQEAGPIQQFVFQIPFTLLGKANDMTMQWSGRKNENGQIDPAFCRILFYLDLAHIKETVVDLHVQNRVISISIINEHEDLQKITQTFIPKLKQALEELNYHLSSINFEKPAIEKRMSNTSGKKALSHFKMPNTYSGVDFRI